MRHALARPLIIATIGCLALLLVPGSAGHAYTQDEPAEAFAATVDYEFGRVMRFRLRYRSETPIARATLFVKAPELAGTLTAAVPVEPALEIDLQHRLDLTEVRLAPFTQVSYRWRLEDVRARAVDLPEQTVEYIDDQFAWQEVRAPGVAVHWAAPDPGIGQIALDVLAEALPQQTAIIPVAPDDPLRIFIYPTANDLRAALRLTGRDWVGAHARPELGVIVVAAANPRTASVDLGEDIRHELSHLLLFEAVGEGYASVPRWLDEGLATVFEGGDNGTYGVVLEEALDQGATIPFRDLCRSFPESSDQALLAYAQSASMVRYLQAEYGNRAITGMLRALADGADCQSMTGRALGVSLEELNRAWLARQLPPTGLAVLWRQGGPLLLVVAAGFGLMLLLLLNPSPKGKPRAQ